MVEEKKTLWDRFTSWVSGWLGKALSFLGKYTGISWVWKSLFGGKGAGKEGAVTPEGETPQKDGGKSALTEKEVSEFVNSVLELMKSNNELGKDLISQLESISQDRFKDILFSYCGSISNIRCKYFDKDKKSGILVLDKETVGDLVKEKEFVQLLSQVKPEISIPKSAQASATAKPEGNGKGSENEPHPVKLQPKMSKKHEEVKAEKVIECSIEILHNKDGEERLMLRVPGYMITSLQSLYNNPKKTVEYLMCVQSYEEANVYQITGTKEYIYINGRCFSPITSLKRQGVEGDAFYELDKMKSILGFNGSKESIAITEMYKVPVAPEVSIPKSAPATEKVSAAVKPKGNGIGAVSQAKYFSSDENSLLLVITEECYKDLKANYQSKDNQEEFCAFVQCDGENLCITGSYASKDLSDGKKAIPVMSVKNAKVSGKAYVKTELPAMKAKVGLDENRKLVRITEMSPKPFEPVVSSHKSAPAAEKVSAAVEPEGNGKGPENGSRQVEPQPETPKVSKKGGQVNDGNTETVKPPAKPPVKPQGNAYKTQNPKDAHGKVVFGFIQSVVHEETFSVENGSTFKEKLILRIPEFVEKNLENYFTKQDEPGKYLGYVECDEKACQIAIHKYSGFKSDLEGLDELGSKWSVFFIDSVKHKDAEEKDASCKFDEMKNILGFNGREKSIIVTNIPKVPIIHVVESSESADPKLSKPETTKKGRQAKNSNSGQSHGHQEKFIGSIKVVAGELKLVVPESYVTFIEKNSNLLYVQCGSNVLRITCNGGCHMTDGGRECFSINSVAMEDGASVSYKLEEMRDKLGFNKTTEVKVIIMSPKQAAEVKSPTNDGKPSPSVTNTDPEQKFVFGKRST